MHALVTDLQQAVKALPINDACSVEKGAKELKAFADAYYEALKLTDRFLAELDAATLDRSIGREHAIPAHYVDSRGRRSMPWTTHNYSTWNVIRMQLQEMVVLNSDRLVHEYTINQRVYRLNELCYSLYAHVLQCMVALAPPEAVCMFKAYYPNEELSQYELLLYTDSGSEEQLQQQQQDEDDDAAAATSEREDASTGEHTAKRRTINMACMPCTALVDHIYLLMNKFNTLRYSRRLEHYVLMLEQRASRLLTCIVSGMEHDSPAFRVEAEKMLPNESMPAALVRPRFRANHAFLTHCAALFCAFWQRFFWIRGLKRASSLDDAPLPFPFNSSTNQVSLVERRRRVVRLRSWFRKRAAESQTILASDWLKTVYTEESVWPGERQLFVLTHPADSSTLQQVASALTIIRANRTTDTANISVNPLLMQSRKDHYDQIITQASTPNAIILSEGLPADEPSATEDEPGHDTLLLQLGLYEHFCHFVDEFFKGRFKWEHYCVMRRSIPLRYNKIITDKTMPYVLQAFNHFGLFYQGCYYPFDSYIEASVAWFAIVEDKLKCKLPSTLNIEDLVESIFHPERPVQRIEDRLRQASFNAKYVFDM